MVGQNKRFSFKIKRQAKNVFPRDVERTVMLQFNVIQVSVEDFSGKVFKHAYAILFFSNFLCKSVCFWYSFELPRLVEAIQMSTNNMLTQRNR